jgi:hypothetical protein
LSFVEIIEGVRGLSMEINEDENVEISKLDR